MNPEAFATLLSTWLCRQAGQLPQALALDGKMIRDQIGLLSLAQHEDGAPQAVEVYDSKEGTDASNPDSCIPSPWNPCTPISPLPAP